MRGRSLILGLILAGAGVGTARAQVPPDHREGEYGGVTPGQATAATPAPTPPKARRARRPPPKDQLTWIGFEAKDGSGQLFFQAPASFNVVQRVDKGQLVLVLEGLHRQVANTRRPLDTRYFDVPIARVTARPTGAGRGHRAGIEVRIAFKNAKDAHEASVRTATEADGMFYAYLDVAGGTTAKPADAAAEPGANDGSDAADGQ
jgi:hypothetical protein